MVLRLNKSSTCQIPGLEKVVRELEALKAEQDAAAEAAFAAKTAVVPPGNVSQVHKTDRFNSFSLLFFLCFVGFSEVGVRILWKRETRGGVFSI